MADKSRRKEPDKNELVVQHNNLIEAKYNLTLQEKRLVLLMSSRIQKDDKEFQTYTFSVQEVCTFLQLNNKNIYKEIDGVVSKLFTRALIIKNVIEDSTTKISWLTYAKYWHGKGLIQLTFNQRLKPYLLEIKERFTKINIGDLVSLKSIYAIRIFELLKQYESIGSRDFSLNELREYCGISQHQYQLYGHLKKRIIEIAKREINDKTDIFIDYEETKQSRKIISINFSIKRNPNYGKTEFEKHQTQKTVLIHKELRSESALIDRIIEYGFTRKTAQKLIKSHNEEVVTNAVKSVDSQVSRGHVKNPKAMLSTAIKEKWKPDVYKDRKKKSA